MKKEEKIKLLKKFVKQKGNCACIPCLDCFKVLLDSDVDYVETTDCNVIYLKEARKQGIHDATEYRFFLSKKKLQEFTGCLFSLEEEQIILDQNN